MASVPVSRRWKRCLRLSVRGLIIVVLVMGAGFGWLAHSAWVQRDAVAAPWVECNDARNYVLLGDPAARLRGDLLA
jgi:hypothetical protein